jgi:hypothetical protein
MTSWGDTIPLGYSAVPIVLHASRFSGIYRAQDGAIRERQQKPSPPDRGRRGSVAPICGRRRGPACGARRLCCSPGHLEAWETGSNVEQGEPRKQTIASFEPSGRLTLPKDVPWLSFGSISQATELCSPKCLLNLCERGGGDLQKCCTVRAN